METWSNFDEQLRRALENLEPAFRESHWELFEQRLLAEDILSGAQEEDIPVDEVARLGLQDLSVPTPKDAWAAFEEKLTAAEQPSQPDTLPVEELVRQSLERYEAPYNPGHWVRFSEMLDETFSLRGKLYRYKVMEAVLMLLLLLTFINFFPFGRGTAPEQAGTPEGRTLLTPAPAGPVAAPAEAPLPPPPRTDAPMEALAASPSANRLLAERDSRQQGSLASVPMAEVQPLGSFSPLDGVDLASRLPNASASTNLRPSILQPGEGLPLLALHSLPQTSGVPSLPLEPPTPPREKLWRFSMFASSDFNIVYSPPELVFDTLIGRDTTFAVGYGGGLTVSFKTGRWEFQSGGIYSFKRYIPKTPDHTYQDQQGYFVLEKFKSIQMDLLQVPLHVHFHFLDQPKWKVYGVGGLSLNLVLTPVYEVVQTRRVQAFSIPDESFGSLKEEKDFPHGLLEGGSFRDNAFLTGNIGLGVERFLHPRWSVFLQPNYQYFLSKKGIGPNQDKIYTLSLHLGTKVSLK